jgi:hypothetical protein
LRVGIGVGVEHDVRGRLEPPLEADVAAHARRPVRGRLEFAREATTSDCFAVLAYSADDGRTWLPLSVPWSTQLSVADLTHVVGG